MVLTIWLVLQFKTSSNLAAAYGVSISLTMVITTLLATSVVRHRWRWPLLPSLVMFFLFITLDFLFLFANVVKIPDGGYFPLLVAGFVFTLMTTWKTGRRLLAIRMRAQTKPLESFIRDDVTNEIYRIPGTAIFMTSDADTAPPALSMNLTHNRVLHQRIIVLSVATLEVPRVSFLKRVIIHNLDKGFYRVESFYGFMETPNVAEILKACHDQGLDVKMEEVTFFLGRETLIASAQPGGMAVWRERLFAFMSRNAQRATQFYQIPHKQVIEIGSQVEL